MARPGIVTLTTDFGLRDAYAAALEAALVTAWSGVRVVHVSHETAPGDIRSGAYLVEYAARTFPAGTVHLGVVDPGVGTARPMHAIETDAFVVIGPGNGLLDRAIRGQSLSTSVALPAGAHPSSPTFQSRDVMAPAAAQVASGQPVSSLGSAIAVEPQSPADTVTAAGTMRVEVAYVDRFGSLILDLVHPGEWPAAKTALLIGPLQAHLGHTFADVDPGDLVAYRGSIGYVEVAVRDGSAAEALRLQAGESVEIGLL